MTPQEALASLRDGMSRPVSMIEREEIAEVIDALLLGKKTTAQKLSWDFQQDGHRQIFCAALAGMCANPNFFGPIMQQSQQAAVEFANEVTLAAIFGADYEPPHKRTPAQL